MIYSMLEGLESWKIALIMLAVIAVLSAICTAADIVRRKLTDGKACEEISAATRRITQGDFAIRLTPRHAYGNYDDYDVIKININKMAAELSKNAALGADFISNVSHEWKTPLSVISGYAAALKKGVADRETERKYLDTLVETSNRLSSLVMNILKLSRLENSSILGEKQRLDLTEMVAQSVLAMEEKIEKKNLDVQCDLDDVTLNSYEGCLETVWNNLLSNAVKFTDEGGRIRLSLKREGPYAVVTVADSGCGISPEEGARIFDKFYQGDTSHASEGNGLGLALVKKVVDLLGGEIIVESLPGQGTTFIVRLKDLD